MSLNNMEKLLEPILTRNVILSNETPEERVERIKRQFNLHHGKGNSKKRKQSNKKKK